MTTFNQEFDRELARLLLEICRYTYAASFLKHEQNDENSKDAKDALDWINKAGNPKEPRLIDDGKGADSTSVACVISFPDKNIVSYMGTKTEFNDAKNAQQSIEDWAKNAEFVMVDFNMTKKQLGLSDSDEKVALGGRAHEGFLKELCAVQEKIIAELGENGGKERPLYITGHSQGGAEAALATRAFLAGGFDVKATYTYAAPRSANKAVADSIPKEFPLHRIEFGNDIVPHVPTTRITHKITIAAINFLSKIGLPSQYIKALDTKFNFVGIVRLCYGNNDTKTLRVDLTSEQEEILFKSRIKDLATHPQDLAEHHHLAGTTAEVKAEKKGNYTALVSEFSMVG